MNDFQKGLRIIIAATRKALGGRNLEKVSVSYHFQDSSPDGAKIAIVAPGRSAETTFSRRDIEDSHQGARVSVQIHINSLVSEFEGSTNA